VAPRPGDSPAGRDRWTSARLLALDRHLERRSSVT